MSNKAKIKGLVTMRKVIVYMLYMIAFLCLSFHAEKAVAQDAAPVSADSTFTVESFRQLPTDVSAFIDAVRDLNGEACALVKVVAPADFAFSSPLGIVKRLDEVGEIWLYLPKGTKTLTLKHPQWGVLRDYPLGMKLESRMTYEMRLHVPQTSTVIVEKHDTVVYTKTVVDTVTVAPMKRIVQLHAYTMLTASMHTDGPSWGIMLALMRRHDGYIYASTNLHSSPSATATCDRNGYLSDGDSHKPYYSGRTQTSELALTAGLIHRLGRHLNIFEGIGYANQTTSWQLAESEGGGWLRNNGLTHKGVSAELGVLAHIGKISFSVSTLTIGGKQWQGCIGIGVCLGKSGIMNLH